MTDPVIHLVCALLLSYVFAIAAWHKWRDLAVFRETLANYQLLPGTLLPLIAIVVPLAESVTAIALLLPRVYPFAASFAAALLTMYLAAIGINLLRGRRRIDCGCAGPNQKQYLSEWLLLRNSLLLLCASLLFTSATRNVAWFDWLAALPAVALGCLLYHTFNQLLVNWDKLILLRHHHG